MATFGKIGARPLLLKNTGEYAEEQMYKELFEKTASRTFNENTDLYFTTPTVIGQAAFSYCTFRNIILPNVTSMGQDAIGHSKVYGDTISLPNLVETTGNYSLGYIQSWGHTVGTGSVLTVSVPKLQTLTWSLFYQSFQRNNGSMRPVVINAESATTINGQIFYNAHGIRRIYAPRITNLQTNSVTFLNLGRRYCGDNRNVAADECAIVLGSAELETGVTMEELLAAPNFPCGANQSEYSPTFYCKDGTVTYDTAQAAWVQNPYT